MSTRILNSRADPLYVAASSTFTEALYQRLSAGMATTGRSRPVLLPIALDSADRVVLENQFPEFQIRSLALSQPPSVLMEGAKILLGEVMLAAVQKYAAVICHLGGSLLQNMNSDRLGVHLEIDPTMYGGTQHDYSERMLTSRVYRDCGGSLKETGVRLPIGNYTDQTRFSKFLPCKDPHKCMVHCDGVVADLNQAPMGPDQFIAKMIQHGAGIGVAAIYYEPNVVFTGEGDFTGWPISYRVTDDSVDFICPGAPRFSVKWRKHLWAAWMVSHVIYAGRVAYQLEHLGRRGPCMLVRVVKIEGTPAIAKPRHVLTMDENLRDYLVVHSWRMKRDTTFGQGAKNWEKTTFLAERKCVEKTYASVHSDNQANPRRGDIRRRLKQYYERWIVQGTQVRTRPPMPLWQLEALTTAIYVQVVTEKYLMGRLTGQLADLIRSEIRNDDPTVVEVSLAVTNRVIGSVYDAVVEKTVKFVRGILGSPRQIKITEPPYWVELTANDQFGVYGELVAGRQMCVNPLELVGSAGRLMVSALGDVSSGLLVDVRGRYPKCFFDTAQIVMSYRSAHAPPAESDALLRAVSTVNEVSTEQVFHLTTTVVANPHVGVRPEPSPVVVVDPVTDFNVMHRVVFPGVSTSGMEHDHTRKAVEGQDYAFNADYVQGTANSAMPKKRTGYKSRVEAYNCAPTPQSQYELLSSLMARNLNPPDVSRDQDNPVVIFEVWENFLDKFCTRDARAKLENFRNSPATMTEEAVRDWAAQADSAKLKKVTAALEKDMIRLEGINTSEYTAMVKGDGKPPLSLKPLTETAAPQTIIYQPTELTALYSSVFRVLAARFLSLLKPEIIFSLRKSPVDIETTLTAVFPWDHPREIKYVENDFSKYDKSQGRMAFELEAYAFTQLGLSTELLERWQIGHLHSSVRADTLGLCFATNYQRKSGDATTALGNGMLNVMSVAYAYKDLNVMWACFVGDDSVIATDTPAIDSDKPARIMAEVFNLQAKMYYTSEPYYASSFVVADEVSRTVALMPDPVKKVESLSKPVVSVNDDFPERYLSFHDSMRSYGCEVYRAKLARLAAVRYGTTEAYIRPVVDGLASCYYSGDQYRSIWAQVKSDLDI